jgi:hypothetical protein
MKLIPATYKITFLFCLICGISLGFFSERLSEERQWTGWALIAIVAYVIQFFEKRAFKKKILQSKKE